MYTKHKWQHETFFNFEYALYLPKDYDENKKFPLVLYLHGAGERGDDPDCAATHGFLKYVREEGRDYPFIILAPQCPNDRYWGCFIESLVAFLDDMCEKLSVDPSRIYLTGLSMGGNATWLLAMAIPHRFAAIAPIAASGVMWYAEVLTHIPIYMCHGDLDEVIPLEESVTMLRAINKRGGNATLEVCFGRGHYVWDVAYSGDKLVNFFLSSKNPYVE